MKDLTQYTLKELEVLQLSLAIAYASSTATNGKDCESNKVIRKWSERVKEAMKELQIEQEILTNQ